MCSGTSSPLPASSRSSSSIPATSSQSPVNVVPTTATTPIVFSSICGSNSSGPTRVAALAQRHLARLDVEVAAELVPDDVDVGAVDEVRLVGRLAGLLARALPAPLHRQRAEHHGLRGARARRAGRVGLAVAVEEVVRASARSGLRDLGRLRVLGVVDVVAVQVGGDHHPRLGLHERGDERREVLRRVAVEQDLGLEQRERGARVLAVLRHLSVHRRLVRYRSARWRWSSRVDVASGCWSARATLAQARMPRRGGVHACRAGCAYYVTASLRRQKGARLPSGS